MENVYIVSDYSNWLMKLIGQLSIDEKHTLSYEEIHEDWEFDNWVKNNVPVNAKAIIIPVELGMNNATSIEGLRIGMHLRLLPVEFNIRTIPILFISNREQSEISLLCRNNKDKNHYDYLLGTKGTDITKPIAEEILSIISNLKPLFEDEYKTEFYDHIKINPSDKIGKHSLANIWGAFRLAEVTGHNNILLNNQELLKRHKELYFKYINAIAQKSANSKEESNQKVINSVNKNILFIDDEANKGWSLILEAIFNIKIETIGRNESESFDAFYQKAKRKALELNPNNLPKWDLILLDLRLDELEDQGDAASKTAKDYSGGRLLLEIKGVNRGTQVIMFTASNKAWNISELLSAEMGADGFYIKESPEYNQDTSFSLNNYLRFESSINDCLKKEFLKGIYHEIIPIEKLCKLEVNKNPRNYSLSINQGTLNKALQQLFLFERLLNEFPFDLKWAFITMVLVIEEIVNECYYGDEREQIVSVDLMTNIKCNHIKDGKRKLALTPINKGQQFTSGEYIVNDEDVQYYNQRASRIPFNFRLTCLLHFKYKLPLDNSIHKYFEIYRLRSDSVAHAGQRNVTDQDIYLVLELLSILIK